MIKSRNYPKLFDKGGIFEKFGYIHAPLDCQFEITSRCNHRCSYCYIPRYYSRRRELTTGKIRSILDQLHDLGCLWITFTGGEPLIREDFEDIFRYAKKKGFIVNIFTNATLIDKRWADFFNSYVPNRIELTLNSLREDVYEEIAGVKGSFKRFMRALGLLRKNRLPLIVKTIGMRQNKDEILKIKSFCRDLDAPFKFDSVLIPRLDGNTTPCRFRLTAREIVDIEYSDPDMVEDCMRGFEREDSPRRGDFLFWCKTGKEACFIDPQGKMSFCYVTRKFSYDLKKIAVKEVFYKHFNNLYDIKYKTDSKCKSCKLALICRWCAGRAVVETGSPERPIRYFCNIAREKYRRRRRLFKKSKNSKVL